MLNDERMLQLLRMLPKAGSCLLLAPVALPDMSKIKIDISKPMSP